MAYVIVTPGQAPTETGDWELSSGTRSGWVAYQNGDGLNPYRPDPPWSQQRGPMLTAVVMDSDFAVLVGWIDGAVLFRLMINEESAAEYGWSSRAEEPSEEVQAAERGQIITGVREWTSAAGLPEPSVDRLDAALARGYVLADEGLFSLLDEIGVTDPGTSLHPADPAPRPSPDLFIPEPGPVDLVDGTATSLPTQPRVVYLAAPIEHAGPRWRRFVRRYELEEWGQPPCIVATSKRPVPAGELTTWPDWTFYIASDPALELFGWHGPLGHDFGSSLPELGQWRWVPDDAATDVLSAVAWARDHVGSCQSPPTPRRQLLTIELPEPPTTNGYLPEPWFRAAEPDLIGKLWTYADLNEVRDDLAAWLADARDHLVEPVTAWLGDRVVTATGATDGPGYGALVRIWLTSAKGRRSGLAGDDTGWRRALTRLRSGQLHRLNLDLNLLNGEGHSARYRHGVDIEVEIRDQFTEPSGPLPDAHPATIVIKASSAIIYGVYPNGLDTIRKLLKDAAIRFGVATGYAHGTRHGSYRSPYEGRVNAKETRTRLDTTTRGVHWGNLIGPGHIAAIGGMTRLQRLHANGQLTRLEQWSTEPELWWYEIAADPFGPTNAVADRTAQHITEIVPAPRTP